MLNVVYFSDCQIGSPVKDYLDKSFNQILKNENVLAVLDRIYRKGRAK